ncbi:MAG TPA: insulinase family protein [Allosphingosinicella sp.]
MSVFRKLGLAGALALAVAVQFGGHAQSTGPVAKPTPVRWAHQSSDLRPDPRIRFGTLPNGMRYALMKNATPPGEASLRLHIGAGSLNERDDQRGLAHFLEHMVLNGTRNVPEGEFVRRLERHGLKFGPDTNASTSFDQTIYMLELPETDPETLDTATFLLREVAGEALLDSAAIQSERGIILSEERSRASPTQRIFEDEIGFMLKGDLLPRRIPIGETEIIRTAPRERFVDFYDRYYRPDNAVFVAVGDFDLDAMEARIRAQFGTWRARGPAGADPEPAALAPRSTETRLLVEPGGPARVTATWVRPPDLRPDTRARRLSRTVESLAISVFNRRLKRIANGESPPFIGASAGRGDLAERAEFVQVSAVARPGEWRTALEAIEQEQRRLIRHGFTPVELEREIVERRTAMTASAAAAKTFSSPGLAGRLIDAAHDDEVMTTPADDLALFEEAVRGLDAAGLTTAARGLFEGQGPLVYMTSPAPVEGGEQALLAAWRTSLATAVAPPLLTTDKAWPYAGFGTPGTVAERRELADLGATLVRFANGVRLTVKPTAFKDDEILVTARFGGGIISLPADRITPAWGLGAFPQGALGKLDQEELEQVLSGTVYGVSMGMDDDAYALRGRTRPADFARQMQILAAYATDPGWRPAGWDRGRSAASTIHGQLRSTPGGVFNRDSGALLHSGDRRWAFPTEEEMRVSSIADLKRVLEPALVSAPIELVVVGDVTVDEAIRQAAATFGALPPRTPPARDPALAQIRFPAPGLVRLTHEGRADQGMAFIAWPTTDFYADQKLARTLNLLGQVLQLRLTDEIREKQGTTYSPGAGHSGSDIYEGYGYMAAQIEAPPEKLEAFLADAARIARGLGEKAIGPDELQRARKPLVENLQRQRASSNGWWLQTLARIQERPEVAESIRVSIGQYESITPVELQAAARRYLVDEKAWKALVVPK